MSHVKEELLPQLKLSDRKRKRIDFAADLRPGTSRLHPELQRMPCSPSVMMPWCSAAGSQLWITRTCSKWSTVSFICLITKPMLPPDAEKLSADVPPLVQTRLGLVGFSWPPPISSRTPLGGLPLRPSARTMQALMSFQMRTIVRPVQWNFEKLEMCTFLTSKREFGRITYSGDTARLAPTPVCWFSELS